MKSLLCFLPLVLLAACTRTGPEAPTHLRCEYLENPLGIGETAPRFSWWVADTRRDAIQTAYQLQVATSPAALGDPDVWDSDKVVSMQSVQVEYQSKPLLSRQRYYWRVRTWDRADVPSPWSETAWFEMAFTRPEDWQGQWIGDGSQPPARDEDHYQDLPAPYFRKTFAADSGVQQARLYLCGLGYYEASLNGAPIGDRVLEPGWTNYTRRALYSVYDVTAQLAAGDNVLGVMLGNGWYNPLPLRLFGRWNLREILATGQPCLLAQLHIDYADGRRDTIFSDTTWRTHPGHILRNNVYLGEKQDGRRRLPGWDTPGFDAGAWRPAVVAAPPGGVLHPQMQPPIRITRTLRPVAITEPRPGTFLVDFGQNFAGVVRMKVRGAAGTEVRLRYGELRFDDGSLNGLTTVACQIKEMWGIDGGPGAPPTAWQEDSYLLRGEGEETFQPHFTFHGFRYVEVSGYPGRPRPEDFEGLRMNADLTDAGTFTSSNSDFDAIQTMTDWTLLSNVFSVQSDCPGREKFGYGGDMVTAGETYIFNYDMAQFYTKTLADFRDDQRPGGGMPECAPYNGIDTEGFGEGTGPIGWQLAYPFLQRLLYQFYGDRRVLAEHYPHTRRMIGFLRSQAQGHRILHGISDHASIDPKPVALTSTAFYYHIVQLGAEIAGILSLEDDVAMYTRLADSIRTAYIAAHVQAGIADTGTQAAQAFTLWYDLLPPDQRPAALAQLTSAIEDQHGGHLATGIFGTKMLFDVLRRYDRADLAYQIADQPDFPGWRWMLANGATTLWEEWEGGTNAPSHNHPMFGSVSEWFYRSLGGINPAEDAWGCDRWVLRPQGTDKLTHATATYVSVRGPVHSAWQRSGDTFTWEVQIPANTWAEVWIPAGVGEEIREGGKVLSGDRSTSGSTPVPGLAFLRREGGAAVFRAGSGSYRFEVQR
ncbi:MAG: glycoside hydrolase family 78 protein [Bacteroidia bacterium]